MRMSFLQYYNENGGRMGLIIEKLKSQCNKEILMDFICRVSFHYFHSGMKYNMDMSLMVLWVSPKDIM